jgi:ATP-binding cassette subfamily B protein
VRRTSPRLFAVVVSTQIVAAALLALQVVFGKAALQALLDESEPGGSVGPVIAPLIGLAVVSAATGLISAAQTHLQRLLGERVQKLSLTSILEVTSRVALADFDDPRFFDDLQRVKINALMRPLALVTGLVQAVGGAIALVGLGVALFVIEPLLVPILLLGGIPLAWLSRRSGQAEFRFAVEQTTGRRLRSYLEEVLTSRDQAKEVRAFDLGGVLRERWERSYSRYFSRLGEHVRHRVGLALASALITAVTTVAALGLLTWLVVDGRMALATAGAALIAVRLLAGRVQQLFGGVSGLFESSLFLRDLEEFLQRAPAPEPGTLRAPAPGPLAEIRADAVTFRYPGSDRDALQDVSIAIRVGETVALVGENGSGKTTLAKLLAQMYTPTDGSVLWNGVDSRELDPAGIRAQVGVIFQDFIRYQLPARDNIGLGRAEALGDVERVEDAARRAGIHAHLSDLPEGYDTVLGKEFLGGYDLSGGQWQRVALARAFFRDAALLVLDEPTAALDARAEHEVFEHVRELAHGRSLLLISHRFSTVRSADRIYVLEGGRVVEAGSHEDLMARQGHYAELFDLQASAYR